MIDLRRQQHSFGDGFIRETVDELWEGWMRHADDILADEELLEICPSRFATPPPTQSHARSARYACGSGTQDVAPEAHSGLELC